MACWAAMAPERPRANMMTGDLFPTMAIQVSGVKLKHGETRKGSVT